MANLDCKNSHSIRPVLIHVNGVSEEVRAEQFFAKIIDFEEMLEG